MKVLVIYDANDRNVERLAKVIGEQLGSKDEVEMEPVGNLSTRDVTEVDLLAVGGPTRMLGRSTPLEKFLQILPGHRLYGMHVVSFGTRTAGPRFLTGSASRQAANLLTHKGALLLVPPESFFTKGLSGPLADGEVERAKAWAAAVLAQVHNHATPENGQSQVATEVPEADRAAQRA